MFLLAAGYNIGAVNPAGQSPIGSPTAVPSAGQKSLVPYQPSTYGMSGNMVMTGNVGGGKEFRGFVPYSSRFYSKSYTSSVDDFMRRSSGDPLATDRNPGAYTPYYDPRRTVTTMYRGGQTGLVAPQMSPQGRPNTVAPSGLPQLRNTPFNIEQRPLSTSPEDVSRFLDRKIPSNPWDNPLGTKQNILTKNKEVDKNKEDVLFKPENVLLPQETLKPIESMQDKKEILRQEEPIRSEQLRKQKEDVERDEKQAAENKTQQAKEPSGDTSADRQPEESELKGKYKTFADLADAKATDYMNAAQVFLQEGKFYKAADHFALAAVWKPDDAQAWMGQVGSLFAAGEYMSSAYYLGQFLSLKPQLVGQKISPTILIQKRDVFENGLVEAQTWQERSQSGELAFLMAYMLWQDGKVERAVDAIAKADTLIPDSEAIKNLGSIIRASSSQTPAAANESGSLERIILPETVHKEPNQP